MNNVREEEQKQNPCRGLGLAAAAISVGVGAALYYFYNKRPEHPHSEGSSSQNWQCEQTLDDSLAETSYSTVSEHTTTDTSVYDSSHASNNEDSFSTYDDSFSTNHDSFSTNLDSFFMISSDSEDDLLSNLSGLIENISVNRSNENISINTSMENGDEESIIDIDVLPDHMCVTVELEEDIFETRQPTDMNETLHLSTYVINNPMVDSVRQLQEEVNNHNNTTILLTPDIPEIDETNESEVQSQVENALTTFEMVETSHDIGNAISFDEAAEWEVTNSSPAGLVLPDTIPPPRSSTPLRHVGWRNLITRRIRRGRKQENLTEEEQMAILRQEAFRERTWSLEECSICFEVMLKNQPLMQLPCAHNFHVACIGPWLQEHQTCPNCRKHA